MSAGVAVEVSSVLIREAAVPVSASAGPTLRLSDRERWDMQAMGAGVVAYLLVFVIVAYVAVRVVWRDRR